MENEIKNEDIIRYIFSCKCDNTKWIAKHFDIPVSYAYRRLIALEKLGIIYGYHPDGERGKTAENLKSLTWCCYGDQYDTGGTVEPILEKYHTLMGQ